MKVNPLASLVPRLRTMGGVYAKDWLRYRRRIAAPGEDYLTLCNRDERLQPGPGGTGYHCLWQWTSPLHAPTVVADLGLRLMRRALRDHPLRRLSALPQRPGCEIDVTFLIGHRGIDRLPHLQATLQSIAGQQEVSAECIVIEQDLHSRLGPSLPDWVRHLHTPPPEAAMPYCRSWAFNVGARHARGRLLVLHDNDMLVPADYASRLIEHFDQGYEVINLKRFIFYLTASHTAQYLADATALLQAAPESIIQNLEGGGSVAISRSGYERIGGMDEAFVGWGGEDNEFWERAQTLRVWPYAYLPLVHLWHGAQPGKDAADNPALQRYRERSGIPVEQRISSLRQADTGRLSGPVPPARQES